MKNIFLTMMAAVLLVVGPTACGGKSGANADTNGEADSTKTETLEVVEPEDPYAYMIPDSTGLFGMLPVHIFSAVWEKDKNAENQRDREKVWRRNLELMKADFESIMTDTIPTEIAEGLDVTIVKPFKPTSLDGGMVFLSTISAQLGLMAVIKVNPPLGKDDIMLEGFDNERKIIWTCGDHMSSGILDNDYRVYAYFNLGGENAGYLSRLAKIVVVKKDDDYWTMNKAADSQFSKACRDFLELEKENREFPFDYGEEDHK